MELVIKWILEKLAQFISVFDFVIFSSGITFLQFVLAVPIVILLIKLLRFSFTQFTSNVDFSLIDNMKNKGYVDKEINWGSDGNIKSMRETTVGNHRKLQTYETKYYNSNGKVVKHQFRFKKKR